LVSIAGPLMNLLVSLFFLVLMKLTVNIPETILDSNTFEILMNIFDYAVWINIVLFVFNLLPIPRLTVPISCLD
jgi:Zn-dependent protease